MSIERKHVKEFIDWSNQPKDKANTFKASMVSPRYMSMNAEKIGKQNEMYLPDDKLYQDLGIKELNDILNINNIKLRPESPLLKMWGCHNCFHRGTKSCPHNIGNRDKHSNGYCVSHIKEQLINRKLMSAPNGLKHLRNINLINDIEMNTYYRNKLNDLKEEDTLGDKELLLLNQYVKLTSELGKRFDKAIQQDEGSTVKHTREFTPNDLNKLLGKAEIIDVTKDTEVDDEDSEE